MRVFMRHARQVAFCSKGMRYFAHKHELDFIRFVREGLDESELRKTGDQTALMAIEAAHKECSDSEGIANRGIN